MKILRNFGYNELPKDTRTVLKTERRIVTEVKSGGKYIYLGIADSINRVLASNPGYTVNNCNNRIDLLINVDGVPLYISSATQMWPVLCSFGKLSPFIVNSSDYLEDFLSEYRELKANGLNHNDKIFHRGVARGMLIGQVPT